MRTVDREDDVIRDVGPVPPEVPSDAGKRKAVFVPGYIDRGHKGQAEVPNEGRVDEGSDEAAGSRVAESRRRSAPPRWRGRAVGNWNSHMDRHVKTQLLSSGRKCDRSLLHRRSSANLPTHLVLFLEQFMDLLHVLVSACISLLSSHFFVSVSFRA